MHPSHVQNIRLQRILLTNLLVLAVAVLGFRAVQSGSPVTIAAVLALPVAIYFINQPVHLVMASYLVGAAGITFKGLPGDISLQMLMQAGVVGVGIGFFALSRDVQKRKEVSARYLIGFLAVIAITIMFRGTGLRVLGSELWGGRGYIVIGLAAAFYLLSPWIRLSAKQVKFLVIGLIVAGFIPVAVQLLFILSGGSFYILAYFVDASLYRVADAAFGTEAEVTRFTTLSALGTSLLPLAFVIPYRGMARVLVPIPIIFLSVLLVGLSGFRGALLSVAAITCLWGLLALDKKERKLFLVIGAVLALVGWLMLIPLATSLPTGIQRAVSWLPFVEVAPLVEASAKGSTDLRLHIWAYALEDLPGYLAVGKGLSFPMELLTTAGETRDPYLLYVTHLYHSGPIGLLLDFGLMGFITVTGFMLTSCREHLRPFKRFNKLQLNQLYYRFLTISFIYQVFAYYFVFGDVRETFVKLLAMAALLRILRYSIEEQEANEETPNRHGGHLPS